MNQTCMNQYFILFIPMNENKRKPVDIDTLQLLTVLLCVLCAMSYELCIFFSSSDDITIDYCSIETLYQSIYIMGNRICCWTRQKSLVKILIVDGPLAIAVQYVMNRLLTHSQRFFACWLLAMCSSCYYTLHSSYDFSFCSALRNSLEIHACQ